MVLQFVGEYVAAFLSETELSLWLGFFFYLISSFILLSISPMPPNPKEN